MIKDTNRVRLDDLDAIFAELAEKYMLDIRDIKLILIESLVLAYGCEDLEIVKEGIVLRRDGKLRYYNIRSYIFKQVMQYFDLECNRRGAKKISHYVETILSRNNYMLYGSIEYRDDYGYEVQPMLTKDEPLMQIDPIYIEILDGAKIPEYMQIIPIELIANSKQYTENKNTMQYKASYMSKNLCIFHLDRLMVEMRDVFGVYVELKVMTYKNGEVYIKDLNRERALHYKIVTHIVSYFSQFGVKAIVKTKMLRK